MSNMVRFIVSIWKYPILSDKVRVRDRLLVSCFLIEIFNPYFLALIELKISNVIKLLYIINIVML